MNEYSKKYSAALIGLGRIGFSLGFDRKREQPASHTMALKNCRRIRLVSGCDTDSCRRSEWNKFVKNAAVYSSAVKMLSETKPDIVSVAVNESSHLECALGAIQAKPRLVILEKPVALTVADGLKIAEASENYKVPVMINHERRFAADYKIARTCLSSIGEIQKIDASLYSGLRVYSEEDEKSGAYSLLHDGTHLFDIVLFFLEALTDSEKVEKVSGCETFPCLLKNPEITDLYVDSSDKKVVRSLSIHYTTGKCPDVNFFISGRSKFFGFEIEITGTSGRICIGNGFFKIYQRRQSRLYSGFYSLARDKNVKIPGKTGYFANMVQNAVDFLDGKEPLGSTLENGMNVLKLIEEITLMLKKEIDR